MQILIWVLSVAGLAAMYWGFRVNEEFKFRMLSLAFVGGVYLWGMAQGMDAVWINATGLAILAIAFWPTQNKPGQNPPAAPPDKDAPKAG